MSKITFKFKKGRITVANKLTYPEAVNEQIYTLVSNGLVENILPVFAKKIRKDTILEGGIEGYVPLDVYLKEVISKKTFLRIVGIVINTVKVCEKAGFVLNNLDLDMAHMMIMPETIELKIIYWPIVNNRVAMPVSVFFKKIGEVVSLPQNDNSGLLDEYNKFFKKLEPFSFNNFEKLISAFNGEPNPKTDTGFSEKQYVPQQEPVLDIIEYDPFKGLCENECVPDRIDNLFSARVDDAVCICPLCGHENYGSVTLCEKCGSSLEIGSDIGNDEDNSEEYFLPILIREKTGEEISINSECFVIGRDPSCACIISSNDYIGRKHAMICFENESFTLTDLSSSNGTYIDGIRLEPNIAYELVTGMRFQLADEFFVFDAKNHM